jgi:large subunit ribosomal protein L9
MRWRTRHRTTMYHFERRVAVHAEAHGGGVTKRDLNMPRTEVILTHNVTGLGAESDHVKVAAGYARNHLIPQGLAIPLTAANKRRLEVLRQRRAEREAHEFNTMSELGRSIGKLVLVLKVKTGEDGKLFGSVTAGTIVDELKHQFDVALEKKKVHLEGPLRGTGDHDVELRLHPEVTATLKVRIESTNPVAQQAAAEAKAAEAKAAEAKAAEPAADDRKRGRPVRKPRTGSSSRGGGGTD